MIFWGAILLIFIVSVLLSIYSFRTFANPFFIFSIISISQIALYSLSLAFYEPLYPVTEINLILYLFSGLLAAITASLAFNGPKAPPQSIEVNIDNARLKRVLLLCGLVGLFASLLYLYNTIQILRANPFAIFSHAMDYRNDVMFGDLTEARGKYISLIVPTANNLGCILAPMYWIRTNRASPIVFLPLFSVLIYSLVIMGRTQLVEGMAFFLISMFIYGRLYSKENAKKIAVKFMAVILVLGSLVIFGIGELLGKNEWSASHAHLLIGNYPFLAQVYDYYTMPLSNFNYISKFKSPEFSLGWSSFRPLMYVLYKIGILSSYSDTPFLFEGYFLPYYGNVSAAIRFYYEDFGLFGIFLLPYLFVFVSSYLFYRLKSKFMLGGYVALILLTVAFFSSTGGWNMWSMQFFSVLFLAFYISLGKTVGLGKLKLRWRPSYD